MQLNDCYGAVVFYSKIAVLTGSINPLADFQHLKKALQKTFEDHRLSSSEDRALRQLFDDLKAEPDHLNYVRNASFDLVEEVLQKDAESAMAAINWLKKVIKAIDSVKPTSSDGSEVYFSPGESCLRAIRSCLKSARKSIDICVFTISDNKISSEIVAAHERGVKVRIITDNDKSEDMGSDIDRFIREGLRVKVDKTSNHMHHKFALFDDEILLNGSFNWTRSATAYNLENVVLSREEGLLKRFSAYFEELWNSHQVF